MTRSRFHLAYHLSWGLLAILAVGCAPQKSALEIEMELARTEGFPTTWWEFRASLPEIPDSDNAGLDYQKLQYPRQEHVTRISQLGWDQLYAPTPRSAGELRKQLAKYSADLQILDRAVQKENCLIPRKWEKGVYLRRPELPTLRYFSKILLAKSSLLARDGQHQEAILEVRKVDAIANHLSQNPGGIEALIVTALRSLAPRQLAELAFVFPNEPGYKRELAAFLLREPRIAPYYQTKARTLEFVELYESAKQMIKLVPREAELIKTGEMPPGATGKNLDLATFVRGYRIYWTGLVALNQPETDVMSVQKIFDNARAEFRKAAGNEVTAEYIGPFSTAGKNEAFNVFKFQERLLPYKVLLRAMKEPKIPSTLDLSDMKLETDGSPVRYQDDGKTMVIQGGSEEAGNLVELRLPTRRPSQK